MEVTTRSLARIRRVAHWRTCTGIFSCQSLASPSSIPLQHRTLKTLPPLSFSSPPPPPFALALVFTPSQLQLPLLIRLGFTT